MVIPIDMQIHFFISTIAGGLIIGLLFDNYRIIRGFNAAKGIVTIISDVLFWMLTAIVVFLVFLYSNYAQIRYYTFIGLILGLFIYLRFISKYILKLLRTILLAIYKFFRILYICIVYPIKKVKKLIRLFIYKIKVLKKKIKIPKKKKKEK